MNVILGVRLPQTFPFIDPFRCCISRTDRHFLSKSSSRTIIDNFCVAEWDKFVPGQKPELPGSSTSPTLGPGPTPPAGGKPPNTCTANGKPGTCIDKSTCKGTTTTGKCLNDPDNVLVSVWNFIPQCVTAHSEISVVRKPMQRHHLPVMEKLQIHARQMANRALVLTSPPAKVLQQQGSVSMILIMYWYACRISLKRLKCLL